MHKNSGLESLNVARIPQFRQRTRQSGVVSPFRLLSHSEARNSILVDDPSQPPVAPGRWPPPEGCSESRANGTPKAGDPVSRTLQRVDFRARLGYTACTAIVTLS